MPNFFSFVFLAMLALTTALRIWLSARQMTHVKRYQNTVPTQFADKITLPAHQKAASYSLVKTRLGLFSLGIEIAVLLALTLGGGLQWLHEFWSPRLDGLTYGIALIFSVALLSGLLDLPLSLYLQFVVEEKFGFNRMTLKLFFADLFKQTLLGVLIGTPVLLAVLWLMSQMGENWWLHVWLFWCAFNILALFLYPVLIAPLFNKFTPLDDPSLKTQIESLLKRCGFAVAGLLVVDGSKRSGHGNAYFTGFAKSRRIVFFDTLLSRLQPAEIEAVLAHELGHFKRHHIIKRIALLFTLSLIFLAALGALMQTDWFFTGLGVSTSALNAAHATPLALLLFFLVAPVFSFLLTPLMSLLSRRHEFEADRYAAEHASADDLIRALVKLYEDNAATLTPDPLHSLFYDSHPPAALRIEQLTAFANGTTPREPAV